MQNVFLGPTQGETLIKTKVYTVLQYFERPPFWLIRTTCLWVHLFVNSLQFKLKLLLFYFSSIFLLFESFRVDFSDDVSRLVAAPRGGRF